MVQTSVPISTKLGIQPVGSGTVGPLYFNESKAPDFEKLTDLVLTSNAFPGWPSRERVQGLVKACLKMYALDLTEVYLPVLFNEGSMQLDMSTRVAAGLETDWNLEPKSRRDKCSSELRIARPKVLIASPPSPLFLKLQNRNDEKSIPLESGEKKVVTTRYHLMFAVRECLEQMHRGDHFIFEHPSNASSRNDVCVRKLTAQPNVFLESKDPCVVGICCRLNLDL